VDWRVLPDDRTDSWLALRVPPGAGGSVAMRLLPPGGAAPLDLPTFVAPAEAWWLQTAGGTPIAAAFGHGEAGHDVVRLVVGATAREDGKPAAPSGAWRVVVTNHGEVEVTVTMQVERDDTPEGYRLRGRQSWLDHPEGWSWEAETAGWTGTGGPISRAGTRRPWPACATARSSSWRAASGCSARMWSGPRATRPRAARASWPFPRSSRGPTTAACGQAGGRPGS
jgi:hypothetical protein